MSLGAGSGVAPKSRLRRYSSSGIGQSGTLSCSSVSSTAVAPASRNAPASTAAPAVTPMASMPAANAARMSQVESPTYQHSSASTSSRCAASRSRSGAGLARSTALPSTMRGGVPSRSAATEAATCAAREEVAMAQVTPSSSSRPSSSRAPGSGRGWRLRSSNSSPARRSISSDATASSVAPARAATSMANRRPSMPIIGSRSPRATGMPNSAKTCSHASMRVLTVSTRVPSRSKTMAAGRSSASGRLIVLVRELHDDGRVAGRSVVGGSKQRTDEPAHEPGDERDDERDRRNDEVPGARDPAQRADLVAEWQKGAGDAEREGEITLPAQDGPGRPRQERTEDRADHHSERHSNPHPGPERSADRYRG